MTRRQSTLREAPAGFMLCARARVSRCIGRLLVREAVWHALRGTVRETGAATRKPAVAPCGCGKWCLVLRSNFVCTSQKPCVCRLPSIHAAFASARCSTNRL